MAHQIQNSTRLSTKRRSALRRSRPRKRSLKPFSSAAVFRQMRQLWRRNPALAREVADTIDQIYRAQIGLDRAIADATTG